MSDTPHAVQSAASVVIVPCGRGLTSRRAGGCPDRSPFVEAGAEGVGDGVEVKETNWWGSGNAGPIESLVDSFIVAGYLAACLHSSPPRSATRLRQA